MKDRELLEAAAHVAGLYSVDPRGDDDLWCESNTDEHGELTFPPVGMRTIGGVWNPLADDGDALRLAVQLRIKFRYNDVLGQGLAWTAGAGEMDDWRANIEECERDEFACARRAIVRAAAALTPKEAP